MEESACTFEIIKISCFSTHPTGYHLLCRESHMFPREDLGILGNIEKLEFRIMTQVTEELELEFTFWGEARNNQSTCNGREQLESIKLKS